MKKVVRTMIYASLAVMMLSCGDKKSNEDKTVAVETPKVTVVKATKEDVQYISTYTSSVLPNVKNNITPQMVARISKLNVEIGDFVKEGQVVAKMDELQYQQAKLQLKNNATELERIKALFAEGGISKSDLEAIELAYEVSKTSVENLLENTTLRSPVSGVITARNYDEGDMFSMSNPIYVVQQITPVKLLVGISESDYSKVSVGDTVSVVADAFPGKEFMGKVHMIHPTINPSTHTFTAEIRIPNYDRALRPGMFVKVDVNFGTKQNVVVPDVAIVKQAGAGDRFVYILNEDGTVSFCKVKLGRRMGVKQEILEGVEDGASVVVEGQVRLKDGIKVDVK